MEDCAEGGAALPARTMPVPGCGRADPRAMAYVRRCVRRAEKRGLWKHIGSLSYRPRALLRAWLPQPASVRIARAHSHKSGLRQRWERVLLVLRLRMDPDAYYLLWLHEPARYARAGEFVCMRQLRNLLAYMLERVDAQLRTIITDKSRFFALCRRHHIPTPEVLATWQPQRGGFDTGAATPTLFRQHAAVFFKPVSGMCGTGAGLLLAAPDGRWALKSAGGCRQTLGWNDVIAHFDAIGEAMVFQRRIRNHSALDRFGTHALHTVRLITFRSGERITPQAASLKLAASDLLTDNFTSGGIAVHVDLTTGRLGAGARFGPESSPASLTAVPESGERFEGLHLPFWPETLAVACRLHGLLSALPSLAHDIAITDDGPMVVEANGNWGGMVLQKAADIGLGVGAFPTLIAEHFPRT